MLDVIDIHAYRGDSYILQGLSLRLEPQQVVGVVGRNGVGKTTLVRSIMGLTPVRTGQILLGSEDITRIPPHRIARKGVGIVPQGRQIFSDLTARENLQVASRPRRKEDESYEPWTLDRALSVFPQLRERLGTRGGKLSGGEQQFLAVARCLQGNPKLMLMDEPTEGLAPLLRQRLGELIQQLKNDGLSILLVEQNLDFVLNFADYVYIMQKGRIVHESPPQELADNVQLRVHYLGI